MPMTSSKPKPRHCRPEAYDLFEAQVQNLGQEGALLRAAVAIAMHEIADTDPDEVTEEVDNLAENIRSRVTSDDPKALLSHAHEVFFIEQGFAGNVENYHDPKNSYLPAVLASKKGIPISLTLLYKEVLERLSIKVEGANAPGHFLAAVHVDGGVMLVDPFFQGRVLSRQEAYERIEDVIGETNRGPELLQPASGKVWLARMLQNLQVIFGQGRAHAELAAMRELQALLDRKE